MPGDGSGPARTSGRRCGKNFRVCRLKNVVPIDESFAVSTAGDEGQALASHRQSNGLSRATRPLPGITRGGGLGGIDVGCGFRRLRPSVIFYVDATGSALGDLFQLRAILLTSPGWEMARCSSVTTAMDRLMMGNRS